MVRPLIFHDPGTNGRVGPHTDSDGLTGFFFINEPRTEYTNHEPERLSEITDAQTYQHSRKSITDIIKAVVSRIKNMDSSVRVSYRE